MSQPYELEQQVDYLLGVVRNSPDHELKPIERINLYKSFGSSKHNVNSSTNTVTNTQTSYSFELGLADKMLGLLAILTANKVLPIWLGNEAVQYIVSDEDYSNNPVEMIKTAEDVICKRMKFAQAQSELSSKFYDGLGGLEYTVNEKIYCVASTAYSTLEVSLYGISGLRVSDNKGSDFLDENISYNQRDFAAFAARAYTSTDNNPPGVWRSRKRYPERYNPLVFDPIKRLEFWEWWLTEAISEAWKLAQTSESS